MPVTVAIECPGTDRLEGFLNDRLSAEDSAVVESHVEHCPACQEALEMLVDSVSLESLLRRRASLLVPEPSSERKSNAEPRSKSHDSSAVAATLLFSDAGTDQTPETIGGHRILGELGRGAFGVVYQGYDVALDRAVAIKVPRPEVLAAMGGVNAYLKEARTLASLDHPHIVRVHEARSDGNGSCYVVSQFIDGPSLADRLDDRPLPPFEAASIVADIADALQHAHERGIYHRDVKPANVLLDRNGRAYLADFGLALREGELGRGPRQLGTPAYTSPEQARGDGHRVDGRTDVYSLGAVFYKMLTGKRPFMTKRVKDLLDLIVNVDPPSARQRNRDVPVALNRICATALARNPTDRYQTAGDLRADVRTWMEEFAAESSGVTLPVPAAQPETATPSRNRLGRRSFLGGLLAAGGLAAAAPFTGLFGSGSSNRLNIGMKPWVGYSPLVVARELGLFDDIDVEFVPVSSTQDVGRKFLSGKIDCAGYLVDSHCLARAKEIPTQAILLLDQSGTADAVIARPEVESFADLAGRRVAFIHHEAPHFLLLSLCERFNVDLNSIDQSRAKTPAETIELFVDGHVDAVVGYDPFLADGLRRRPGSRRIASAADVPGSIIDIFAAHEDLVENDRPRLQSVIRGWMRGLERLEQRDERALAAACEFLGVGGRPISVAEYDHMADGMRYAGIEENLAFFTADSHGLSDFHRKSEAAQNRWNEFGQLPVRTDPHEGDGSDLLLELYGEGAVASRTRMPRLQELRIAHTTYSR